MSKAVLVLNEMPSSCDTCRLEKNNHCCITGKGINTVVRPVDKCPLRPMPEKQNDYHPTVYGIGYEDGWNDAIQAIEGSGEDENQ